MNKSDDSVIILAAGDGSRLKSSVPKIFHKIGGLSLLDHVVKSAKEINPREIVVVIKEKYSDYSLKFKGDIRKAYQAVPKGSADAVKCALKSINLEDDGYVYVLYADIPLVSSETLIALADTARKDDKTAVVVLAMNSEGTKGLGKLEPTKDSGTIKRIVEAKDALNTDNLIPLCNAGLLIKKTVLKKLINEITPSKITGEFYITKIVEMAYESGYNCRYYEGNKKELSGVNTREELSILERFFQDRERQKHMDNGVTLVAPETVFFSFDTVLERDVIVHPYVVFSEGVHVKTGTQVKPFCVLEGAEVQNAQIGPFARLRKGSDVRNEAKIGNFVEIKNSVIEERTKVNHLSYVGDSTIGKNTNIGAGTITCNYDGFKKSKTTIGENVFVGSNTALVAPVTVYDNAMIGAGSIITKDVEADSLAISRAGQQNIKNGAANFKKIRSK